MTRTRAAVVSVLAAAIAFLANLTGLLAPSTADATGAPVSTVVSSAPAPNAVAGTTRVIQLPFGGTTREYHLFVPTKLAAGPRPLLIALHGYTSDASFLESTTNLDKGAAKNGVIVAYPQGLDDSWNAGTCCGTSSANNVDDVDFIATVIHDVAAYQVVDANRIAIAGGSNGGMMAYRFACERADLVHVIDVMVGTFVAPSCSLRRPVSLLHVHGLLDTLVPFKGAATSSIDATGFPNVKGMVWGIAGMDDCDVITSSPYTNYSTAGFTTAYNAQNCPAGTMVQLVTSSTMHHTWATGSSDLAKYGVDMTGMVWGFDLTEWSTEPAPSAL